MAPAFRSAGALSHGIGAVTPGAPAGLTANDIEFLLCESMDEAISLTTANGFVEVTGSPISVPSGTATIATRGALFWRRWNGAAGDPTVGDPGDHVIAQRFAFSGCTTSDDPWDFIQTSSEATEDTSGSATGATTADADRLIAIFIGAAKPDSTSTTEVSGFTNSKLTSLTERADNAGDSGNGGHIGLATGVMANAGHTGATTYTKVTSAYKWHFVVALKASTPFIQAEMYDGSAWQALNPDVVNGTLRWGGGITGSGPLDRVANVGICEFELLNGENNSAATVGYYSPDHSSKRTGWALGTKIRVKMFYSGGTFKIWNYRVKSIAPIPGQYGPRKVEVTAVDYMDEFAKRKISQLPVQTAKRGDELVTTLVATMPIAPDATSYTTGVFSFPYAFHAEQDEKTSCLSVLQKVAQSELSYIYMDGSASGSTLYYKPHTSRLSHNALIALGSTTSVTDFELERTNEEVWNDVHAVTFPVEVGTTDEVLAEITEEVQLEPGETKTLFLRYVDTNTGQRISGINPVTPESGTDYRMASAPGTTNNDLSAFITVTPTTGANTVLVQVGNTHTTVKGFVNLLQVRGRKVTLYNQVESTDSDSTSINTYGTRTMNINMPYQSESAFGLATAQEIVRRFKDPGTDVRSAEFIMKSTDGVVASIVSNDIINNGVSVNDTVTGLFAAKFFINAAEYEWLTPSAVQIKLLLERSFAPSTPYFLIDSASFGQINGANLIAPF